MDFRLIPRLWLGALSTPLITALAYLALILLDPGWGKLFTIDELVESFVLGMVPVNFVLCYTLGIPLIYLLIRRGRFTCWRMIAYTALLFSAVGAVISGAVTVLAIMAKTDSYSWEPPLLLITGAGGYGAFVAGVFAVIAGIPCRSRKV